MAERRKRLTEKLVELDKQLESEAPLDAQVEAPLKEAIGRVRDVAESSPDTEPEPEHEGLGADLGDIAIKLEVSHPRLTELLNHISDILAGTGF